MQVTRLLVLLVLLAVMGCDHGAPGSSSPPAPPDRDPGVITLHPPTVEELAKGVHLGDQTDQWLESTVADGSTVVAVGGNRSGNTTRPLFLHSSDDGASWSMGQLDDSARSAPGAEAPTLVAHGDRGFIALGSMTEGGTVIWRSPDGATWSRRSAPRRDFGPADEVAALVWANHRFYAAGTTRQPLGASEGRVILWTSRDGSSWHRLDVSASLPAVSSGSPYVVGVAATSHGVVVAGGQTSDGGFASETFWSSTDGRRFYPYAAPDFVDGHPQIRAYVTALEVVDDEFVAALREPGGRSWDGWIVTGGQTGMGWEVLAKPAAFGTAHDQWITNIAAGPAGVVLVGTDDGPPEDVVLAAGKVASQTRRVSGRDLGGAGSQVAADVAATTDGAVLVGWSTESGVEDPTIWRMHDGQVERVDLPDEASEGIPGLTMGSMSAIGGRTLIVGTSSHSATAWWQDSPGGEWEAAGLPGLGHGITATVAADAVRLASGDVLAVGTLYNTRGSEIGAWRLADESSAWTPTISPAFTSGAAQGYGHFDASAVARRGRTVVIAGDSYANGASAALPIVSRDDGRSWSYGAGTRRDPNWPTSGDYPTPWLEFRDPDYGQADVHALVATRQSFVMGGELSADDRSRPVAWTSRSGARWSSPGSLPLPRRVYEGWVTALVEARGKVVAVGQVRRAAGDPGTTWMSWVSADAGATWHRGGVIPGRHALAPALVAGAHGFYVVGAVGPQPVEDAALWSSADGLRWHRRPLAGDGFEGPGAQVLVTASVSGTELSVVGVDVPPGGGDFYTRTVQLPAE